MSEGMSFEPVAIPIHTRDWNEVQPLLVCEEQEEEVQENLELAEQDLEKQGEEQQPQEEDAEEHAEEGDDDDEEDLPAGYLIRRRVSLLYSEGGAIERKVSVATKAKELIADLTALGGLDVEGDKGGKGGKGGEDGEGWSVSQVNSHASLSLVAKAENMLAHLAALENTSGISPITGPVSTLASLSESCSSHDEQDEKVPPTSYDSPSGDDENLGSAEFEEEVHTKVAADLQEWAQKDFANEIIQWKRKHRAASRQPPAAAGSTIAKSRGTSDRDDEGYLDFLAAVFPENIAHDPTGKVKWVDNRVQCEQWQGLFSKIHADDELHAIGDMPGYPLSRKKTGKGGARVQAGGGGCA
jgi:hypothetical protein